MYTMYATSTINEYISTKMKLRYFLFIDLFIKRTYLVTR